VKLKGKKYYGLVFMLIAIILTLGLVGGCTSGTVAVGWSGGMVGGQYLYVGSNAGRLVSINLTDDSVLRAEAISAPSSSGLLSCVCGGAPAPIQIYGTPLVTDNMVFMAGYNGKIYSYRADNLAQRWVYPANSYLQAFVGGIVIYNNVLYVGCSDGYVYALDANTGVKLHEYKTGDKIWGTPAVDPVTKTLFIGSYDKKLYALDLGDLTPKKSFAAEGYYATKGSIISTPLVDNGIVYFGSFDRNLYALNTSDGKLVWSQPFRGNNWFWAQPVIFKGVLYAGCLDGFVYALDPANGNLVHQAYDLKSGVASPPVIVDNLIVFVSRQGILSKLDTATMTMTQIVDLKVSVDGPILAHNGIVYIHPQQTSLFRINPVSGAELPAITL
jgi:eukaryotic-like serine/threonine-protein kinase